MVDAVDIGIVIVKAIIVMHMPLGMAAMVTWVERKGSALIQNRIGANRASILGFDLAGIFNTLIADPVKAITKEDFVPKGVSQFLHSLAPFLGVFPVIISFAVIPFGPPFETNALIAGLSGLSWFPQALVPHWLAGKTISLQLANLNVGLLYIFAMGSLAVYGTMLAGWVSNNKFSLFGSLRASAQMISYEITMGLSLVGLLCQYETLDLNEIVAAQSGTVLGVLPNWGLFMSPFNAIAFILFFISMMAETKRNPFDLPESESELVAGYMTEYSGMKFLLFWLGEFAEIVVASALIVTLFFGGWQLPYIELAAYGNWACLVAMGVFAAKTAAFSVLQVIIRWTVPRFRYDQVMNLCWKIMLPTALVNLVASVIFVLWRQG